MEQRQYFSQSNVEIEMLYGIRSDMLSNLKNKGHNARVYLTYGKSGICIYVTGLLNIQKIYIMR